MDRSKQSVLLVAFVAGVSAGLYGDDDIAARRAELRERFDENGDGWLSAGERDAMRRAQVEPFGTLGRGRSGFRWPPEVVKRFDVDGDGELDEAESEAAGRELRRRWEELQREYDANGDGRLDEREFQALGDDTIAGKTKDVPFFIRDRFKRRGRRARREPELRSWESFDENDDGRLSAAELATVRRALEKADGAPVEVSPSRRPPSERPSGSVRPSAIRIEERKDEEKRERVGKLSFSHRGGIYEEPISLVLSSRTPSAEIRYTLDCTEPTETTGEIYREPLRIAKTTVVRAAAFYDGLAPRRPKTSTFVFLRDVIRQSRDGLPPPDAPYRWGRNIVDYGMDPEIVDNPRYRDAILRSLESLPSISLVLDPDDLFGGRGIYAYARMKGREAERPGSFEMFFPDHRPGIRENCGVRIRGGFSRTSGNPKHGFRLFFRKEYGPGKLRYPLFGRDGAEEFDNLDLRCSQNYSWNLGGDPRGLFVRDQFSRDTQLAMGHPAARGEYYHLYLNGQYWGLYNSCERVEASFGETYLGGAKEDYDVVKTKQGEGVIATDGNMDAWSKLLDLARPGLEERAAYERIQGNNADGTRNAEYERLLDVDNLIDYMLVIFWAGNLDAPVTAFAGNRYPNNWYGMRSRSGDHGFRFFVWDAEHTLLDVEQNRLGPFPASSRPSMSNPQWLWQQCLENAEFRVRVGDRIERHFAGALATNAVRGRFEARVRQIEDAVIAESARWGDTNPERNGSRPLTRDEAWRAEVERVLAEYIPRRGDIVRQQLWEQGLIPEVGRPEIVRSDSPESEGPDDAVVLESSRGEIYYTVDGTDPREVGGAVSNAAVKYDGPIHVASTTRLCARTRFEGEWSALLEVER